MREFRNLLFLPYLYFTSLLIKSEISVSRMLQYVFVLRMKRATEAFLSYALKRHLPICFCMSCRAGQHVKCLCEFVKLFCMNSWNCIWKIKWIIKISTSVFVSGKPYKENVIIQNVSQYIFLKLPFPQQWMGHSYQMDISNVSPYHANK